jgi:hypothetical protein
VTPAIDATAPAAAGTAGDPGRTVDGGREDGVERVRESRATAATVEVTAATESTMALGATEHDRDHGDDSDSSSDSSSDRVSGSSDDSSSSWQQRWQR